MCCLKILLFLTFICHLALETDGVDITFKIEIYKVLGKLKPTCDHDIQDMKSYTVREGENIMIKTIYGKVINDASCYSKYTDYSFGTESQNVYRNESTYKASKEMGMVWECSFTSLKDNSNLFKEILYTKGEDTYARTICTMYIHVRRQKAPMVILVNNMQMALKQTPLSDEEADFTAIHHYKVGDKVYITCVTENYNEHDTISMQSPNVGKLTHSDLNSSRRLFIKTTLTSLHDGKYYLFTLKNQSDYTSVRLRFIETTDDPMNITINGILMRPQLNNIINNQYTITYVHKSNSRIYVICETTPNYKLLILNKAFWGINYYQNELTPEQKINIHFTSPPNKTPNFRCSTDNRQNGHVAQACDIMFKSDDKLLNDTKIMEMVLPANRTVLEVSNETLQVIYYEFDADEDLEIKCSVRKRPVNVVYMHFQNNYTTGQNMISKLVTLKYSSSNPPVICYLRDQVNDAQPSKRDEIMYQIEVKFVPKDTYGTEPDLTTTTTTIANRDTLDSDALNSDTNQANEQVPYEVIAAIGAVAIVIIISIFIILLKVRKRNQTEGNPQNNNYENLPTPSDGSIPPYPSQWESNNYAVPVDQRHDEPSYSVPIQPLYAEPVPKNARKPKQNQVSPTYAILNHPNKPKRNVIKDTNDPNYSEVYSRNNEAYANVIKENSPYVNADEPMYCEASVARSQNHYTNVHSSPYANSSAQEYVEPTYCEPQRR
ncbi:uncharacterized protein LOC118280211 isoform X1 [Spodoptera frugiperda]|uniref:Uncharacterized protein LOC118280211 isoform X1 n=1 Tax=Spodoptera frugiperda TaxID=7108 RepID=A0A9R0E3K0_SPOFR|nr:uncharacterized protein LOC118280211 isoform X1 [Spodoptera frugiperda]